MFDNEGSNTTVGSLENQCRSRKRFQPLLLYKGFSRILPTMKKDPLARVVHPASPGWSTRLHVAPSRLSSFWRSWLFDQGSLTTRLVELNQGEFSVEVSYEGYTRPTAAECKELRLSSSARIWSREVVLKLGSCPVVYARTVVPQRSLKGPARQLRFLGNQSLGTFLFAQPSLRRSPLKVSRCQSERSASQLDVKWCRRSVFHIFGRPLMVSEAFTHQFQQLAYQS